MGAFPTANQMRIPVIAWLIAIWGDFFLYRSEGYTGFAVFLVGTLVLLLVGIDRSGGVAGKRRLHTATVGFLLALVSARLVWLGAVDVLLLGLLLLPAFVLARFGHEPFVWETVTYVAKATLLRGMKPYTPPARNRSKESSPPKEAHDVQTTESSIPTAEKPKAARGLEILLPIGAVLLFAAIFTMANPDMIKLFRRKIELAVEWVSDFFRFFTPMEIPFFVFVLLLFAGLLRPWWFPVRKSNFADIDADAGESPLFAAFRNTLLAVVCLFAAYLGFEFSTLWLREFPKNFYYAGYAHEGAAWLTMALALATALLSLMFRGGILADPRLAKLKRLAWYWSALNMLLAVSVYNRLWIYIRFNGMTRMRVVGLFGISAVVVGFVLVIIRIRRHYNFVWLVRRQLWTLFCAITLYCVLPVDIVVHTYNVRCILHGQLAPSVQITEHPVDEGGCLMLIPLLDCENEIIREGIAAMLMKRQSSLMRRYENANTSRFMQWTARQIAHEHLRRRLKTEIEQRPSLAEFQAGTKREQAWNRFQKYAWQWY